MIASIAFPLIEMQKAYGRNLDPKLVMRGWEAKLAGRFPIPDILRALDLYTDLHDDFPAPGNIIAILDPKPPRITEAAFVEAQKWQERNGFPAFSEAAETIAAYRAQEREARAPFEKIEAQKIAAIAGAAVKKIGSPREDQSETLQQRAVKTGKMPWDGMTWETMTDDIRAEFARFCNSLPASSVVRAYCQTYGADPSALETIATGASA